jgi:secreted trypsin-like serine protease
LQSKESVGRLGYITGWGRLSYNGRQSEVLQEAPIRIVSQEDCGKAFESYVKITDVYLCAGTVGATRDSCQGDSGGPLVQTDSNGGRFYLTGIVSFGRRCATPGFPGVYARVSHFLNWISKNIWRFFFLRESNWIQWLFINN